MCRNIFLTLLAFIIFASTTEAAKVDMYRDALLGKSFTLKYEITTPPVRKTANDGFFILGEMIDSSGNIKKSGYKGVIAVEGDNEYIEVSYTQNDGKPMFGKQEEIIYETALCKLTKDGEVYNFMWDNKWDKKTYYDYSNHFVKNGGDIFSRQGINYRENLLAEYNYGGSAELSRALRVLLPADKIIDEPNAAVYKFVGAGTLPNGLSYEDFAADNANFFSAARYYFNGDNLVKIAMASYVKGANGIQGYEKSVVNITEFSTTSDASYFSIPKGVKDKSKSKKSKGAKK